MKQNVKSKKESILLQKITPNYNKNIISYNSLDPKPKRLTTFSNDLESYLKKNDGKNNHGYRTLNSYEYPFYDIVKKPRLIKNSSVFNLPSHLSTISIPLAIYENKNRYRSFSSRKTEGLLNAVSEFDEDDGIISISQDRLWVEEEVKGNLLGIQLESISKDSLLENSEKNLRSRNRGVIRNHTTLVRRFVHTYRDRKKTNYVSPSLDFFSRSGLDFFRLREKKSKQDKSIGRISTARKAIVRKVLTVYNGKYITIPADRMNKNKLTIVRTEKKKDFFSNLSTYNTNSLKEKQNVNFTHGNPNRYPDKLGKRVVNIKNKLKRQKSIVLSSFSLEKKKKDLQKRKILSFSTFYANIFRPYTNIFPTNPLLLTNVSKGNKKDSNSMVFIKHPYVTNPYFIGKFKTVKKVSIIIPKNYSSYKIRY